MLSPWVGEGVQPVPFKLLLFGLVAAIIHLPADFPVCVSGAVRRLALMRGGPLVRVVRAAPEFVEAIKALDEVGCSRKGGAA